MFTEKDAAKIIKQILEAVAYLHDRDIVHRDLKPENVLLESKQNSEILERSVKIIDFGFAAFYDSSNPFVKAFGSPYYAAPEVYDNKGYDQKCDIWSIGIIMYILLIGEPPFNGNTDA